jgi:hypothetical protein
MIDTQMFVNSLNGTTNKTGKTSRAFIRGYLDIERDLIDAGQLNRPFTTVCELGIGGGGKQRSWKLSGAEYVVGVDKVDANEQDIAAQPNLLPGVEYFWSMDSYDDKTPLIIDRKFDLIIDDSDTGEIFRNKPTNKKNVINVWKDYLANDGLFISETPNGQDQNFEVPQPLEYHMQAFEYLASTGMVIFDTYHFKGEMDTRVMRNKRTTYHLGVYTKRWDIYKPVMEKYMEHIVCGKENIN